MILKKALFGSCGSSELELSCGSLEDALRLPSLACLGHAAVRSDWVGEPEVSNTAATFRRVYGGSSRTFPEKKLLYRALQELGLARIPSVGGLC